MAKEKHYSSGEYIVENKEKYIGEKNPKYRSSWEQKFCYFLDHNTNILRWGYESVSLTYFSPIDNKTHRYFLDFYFETVNKQGNIEKYLVEVKPYEQTLPPKKPKNKKGEKRFLYEAQTYIINKCKWEAAEKFCKSRGVNFQIITEKHLFLK
jgi:hypothetical protein